MKERERGVLYSLYVPVMKNGAIRSDARRDKRTPTRPKCLNLAPQFIPRLLRGEVRVWEREACWQDRFQPFLRHTNTH